MTYIHLVRDVVSSDCVQGMLLIEDHVFYTIERPWLDNMTNKSCIPTGEYDVIKMSKSASGKYRNVFHVLNVKDRNGILMHNGNLVKHSLGCIIVGKNRGVLGGEPAVLSSKPALQMMNRLLPSSFKLIVI